MSLLPDDSRHKDGDFVGADTKKSHVEISMISIDSSYDQPGSDPFGDDQASTTWTTQVYPDDEASQIRTAFPPSLLDDHPLRMSSEDLHILGASHIRNGTFLSRLRDSIYAHVDPRSIFHLLDFRPWFYPFTVKKYIVLFVLAGIIAGIIISNWHFHWLERSLEITRSYMLPVLVISVCAEPLIVLIILPVAKIPDIPREKIDLVLGHGDDVEGAILEKMKEPQGPYRTALVIPCHNTDHVAMRTTIDSALPHFRPQDILIIDNGRSKYPTHPQGNFRQYIRSIHPDIVYIWSPIGSKNAAQLVGALAARDRGYEYIMTVDDDVCIPKNFEAPTDLIDDKFKAVAYPIKAMDAQGEVPLWLVAWQDVEYRLSGMSKLAEDRLCGVQFPHGAGWFVELESFITLMEWYHPMDFIAEDCNAGLGLSRMGKGIRFDSRSYLATEVPTTFFGPGLNWWKQRQKSWEMGRHGRLFVFVKHFLWSMPPKKTIQGILWHKISFLYLICTIIIDWLRIPTIVALGRTATWWRNALLLMLFSVVPPLVYNYWKCRRRPDMRVRFWACVTFPWYKQIYVIVAICGAIRWAGYFLGGHQVPPTIQEMLKAKDDRCFWLDPRFKQNPAWLADEGGMLAEEKMQESSPENFDSTIEQAYFDLPIQRPGAIYSSPLLGTVDFDVPQSVSRPETPHPRGSPEITPVVISQRAASMTSALDANETCDSFADPPLEGSPLKPRRPSIVRPGTAFTSATTLVDSLTPTCPDPAISSEQYSWNVSMPGCPRFIESPEQMIAQVRTVGIAQPSASRAVHMRRDPTPRDEKLGRMQACVQEPWTQPVIARNRA